METFITIAFGIGIAFCLFVAFKPKTAERKEYERKLNESLEDEYIIDPETGAKITLEEAESGHWISHDNEFRTVPESDLEKLLTDEEKQIKRAINYLRKSKVYKRTELTEEQFDLFDETKILTNYDDWSYSHPFSFENGIVILPAPEIHGTTYYEDDYKESHLMFWKKIRDVKGHYYLREKSSVEKVFDKFRNDDDLTLENYESFTFKNSLDILRINNLLTHFENQTGLEIEIMDDNLFVKTKKIGSTEDIKRIENLLKNVG